ncbi:hypothetical protein [Metamycoplasma equirhinis]|uniref:hypothetical protein n=1 Tax=Metamycoplasma equirhinis TaxID=92402 RepID=UPI00359CA2C2
MKKKFAPFYLAAPLVALTSVIPITVACKNKSKDPNELTLPQNETQKYLEIKTQFEKLNILDLDNMIFPNNFDNYLGSEYFNNFAKTWAFGSDDYEKAKTIDKTKEFLKNDSGFLKFLKEKNYETFFNINFKIILRTQYLYSTLLFKFFLLPKYQFEIMQTKSNSEYFNFKYYATINRFVYPNQFKYETPEDTSTRRFFKIASYVVPAIAIIGLATYIGVAIAIKKRKQKVERRKHEWNNFKADK